MAAMEPSFYPAAAAVPPSKAGTSDSPSTGSFTQVGESDVLLARNSVPQENTTTKDPSDIPEWIWHKKGGWMKVRRGAISFIERADDVMAWVRRGAVDTTNLI